MIAGGKGLRVEEKRDVFVDTSQLRAELPKRRGEPIQVPGRAFVADVGVVRDGRRTVQTRADASDHHETNAVTVERLEREDRVEGVPLHRRVAPARRRSRLRPSRAASRSRSPGDSARRSLIWVRSIPAPGRDTVASATPQAASSRSRVSTLGTTAWDSIRAMVGCGVWARRASPRWESPALRRASRSVSDASMAQMIARMLSPWVTGSLDAVLRRPGPAAAPVEEPGHEGTEREPAHVGPIGDPAPHVRPELAHAAEQLEHEPDRQDDAGGDRDDRDEEEDDQRQNPGEGEQQEVSA